MTHVALTCPRLLFTLGFERYARPGQRDPLDLTRELEPFGTVRRGAGWFVVELADSQDAVLAYHALHAQSGDDMKLMSIVGSADAGALFTQPSIATAWATIRDELTSDEPDDFTHGIAAARHFRPLRTYRPPAAITHGKLPDAPLVLWAVADEVTLEIDQDPFELGPLRFTRGREAWRVGPSVTINGQRSDTVELAPGMVIQRAVPEAYVVL